MSRTRPYLFRYWQAPAAGTPGYIPLCLETQARNGADAFEPILLDWESCLDWVPERDALWSAARPKGQGRSTYMDARHIAIFTDLLRIRLLAKFGGLWMDADTIAFPGVAVLAEAVKRYDFVAAPFGRNKIMNGIMGGRPGSPFFRALSEAAEAKRADTTDGAAWGAFGFRLIQSIAHRADPQTCLILPAGALNQNTEAETQDLFQPRAKAPHLGPLTLCVSLHNASMPEDVRKADAGHLKSGDHAFGHLWRQAATLPSSTLTLEDAASLNQSEFVLAQLTRNQATNTELARLKSLVATQQTRLQKAHARAARLKSRLDQRSLTPLNIPNISDVPAASHTEGEPPNGIL